MKKVLSAICVGGILFAVVSCMGMNATSSSAVGGEVTGVGGTSFSEPIPYGMVEVARGSLKMGMEKADSLWGSQMPVREISVDAFWMDEKEVSNSKYRQFVYWVRDSIIRERLADPAYGGDETFKIEEDKNGDPITPHLNWAKPIPWKNPDEDQQRAIESVYITHPFDGTKMLDASQMNYRYEVFDYAMAAMRKYRLNPAERNLNTDVAVDENEVVMISKDTAYIDDDGRIRRETITRPLSSMWDFVNTYIVNIYPDTTCWVNDFQNAENAVYMRTYFNSPVYDEYPVVGVDWEQATAFCNWRTDF
jgi:formylglycine-generating enzyme required for sulfatase activity